jgi:hypothetical protein
MPNLHIIIGDSNTRKSSLLRCMTGVGGGSGTRYMDLTETSGDTIRVYCILSALQENYKPLFPAEFVKHVKSLPTKPTDVAFTLRVSPRGLFPGFNEYLQAFTRAGWPVVNVALLGPSAFTQRGQIRATQSVISVPLSPEQPTNLTATKVRAAWRWR